MKRFPVWNLANEEYGPVLLYKSDESHYVVTQDGIWTPILSCGLYVIINQELLSFFQQYLDMPVDSHPVLIYDRVLDENFQGYHRIYIKDQISPETFESVEHSSNKIWFHQSSGGIFISSGLKNELEDSNINGLKTYQGFSHYAGSDL
jgi:hypothetical protein